MRSPSAIIASSTFSLCGGLCYILIAIPAILLGHILMQVGDGSVDDEIRRSGHFRGCSSGPVDYYGSYSGSCSNFEWEDWELIKRVVGFLGTVSVVFGAIALVAAVAMFGAMCALLLVGECRKSKPSSARYHPAQFQQPMQRQAPRALEMHTKDTNESGQQGIEENPGFEEV